MKNKEGISIVKGRDKEWSRFECKQQRNASN